MKRKRAIILLSVLGAAIICLAIAYFVILPMVIGRIAKHTLAAAGVEHVSLDVSRASFWHAHLADVKIGLDSPIEVRDIGLHYSPQEVIAGNLNAIVLSGVTVPLTVKDGKIEAGPITKILAKRAASATKPAETRSATTAPTLPVDRIVLRDSALVINTPRGPLRWPMNAALLVNREHKYALNMTLRTLDEFTISGTIDPNGEVIDLTAGGEKIRAEMLGQILEGLTKSPVALKGQLAAKSHLVWNEHGGTLTTTLKPQDLAFANLTLASGVFQIDTNLGGPAPAAKLAIRDAQVQAAEIKADGVNANVQFTTLSPLATAPAQQIAIAKVTIGDVEMTNGTIQFEMKSPQAIRIERTHWNVLGGTLSAGAFDINPSDPNLQVTISGRGIDVKQLLDVFGQGKVTGSGKLSGELPLTITKNGVQFGQGALVATKDGQITVKDLTALAQTLGQTGGAKNQSSAQQVRQNIIEALADFQYDALSADLVNDEEGKLMAIIHLGGQGRTGAKQAISIDLRIRGIEDLLRVVLNIRSRINQAQSKGGRS
ncbi:MAG TPA: YdbH domain-containing protein [Tepidisphaeraceae bacterium]|nr:YdbH domain-containing protein [Tepidisphaeraceae bacterium]